MNDNAVETAKVTLMLARRLASRSAHEFWDAHADLLPGGDTHALQFEKDLPLDNLDKNIVCADALFTPWPEADAIIGNPPFQSKNKMQQEFGPAYVQKLRKAYPTIPGRADFCVYWFRRAHDHLKSGQRAGLVGTNTIRQNYSRKGGLDHIVNEGGTILEAVSSQPWSGEAAVHVSIVNWIKGESKATKTLQLLTGTDREGPWEKKTVPQIEFVAFICHRCCQRETAANKLRGESLFSRPDSRARRFLAEARRSASNHQRGQTKPGSDFPVFGRRRFAFKLSADTDALRHRFSSAKRLGGCQI